MRVEIDGLDVSDRIIGGTRISAEIGQRSLSDIVLQYPPNVPFRHGDGSFCLPAGETLLLADGNELHIASEGFDIPPFRTEVTIDHPDYPYRAHVMDLEPWLYWRLDEGAAAVARDSTSNNRSGQYASTGILQRHAEPPNTAVPYGAAPRFETGAIVGPELTPLRDFTIMFWMRISADATGVGVILDIGDSGNVRCRCARERQNTGRHWLNWALLGTSINAGLLVDADTWMHVALHRRNSRVVVSVNGVPVVSSSSRAVTPRETAGRELRIGSSNSHVDIDELSVHHGALTDEQVSDAASRRLYWRAFGGFVYAPRDVADGGGGRQIRLRTVGFNSLMDRLHVEGVFASASDQPAGDVLRSALESGQWPYSSDGCDLNAAIGRVVARQKSLADVARDIGQRAVALPWVDNWGDVHLDTATEVRRLPVDITDHRDGREATIAVGWTRETIPTRWRTRTIVVGAAIAGGLVVEPTRVADGTRRKWDLLQQVSEIVSFTVNGQSTPVGESAGDPWYLGAEKYTLNAATAPVSGTVLELSYIGTSPLVASAEDQIGLDAYGRFERLIEDDSLDTIEAVQERATSEQTAHGRPGLEIRATLRPRELPLLTDAGGAPRVLLGGSIDQRMLIERLETRWLPGGENVVQSVTLRAHDYSSDLEYWSRERRLTQPPQIVQPIVPPAVNVAIEGLSLPVELGGSYNDFRGGEDWVDVLGAIRPILDGHLLGDVRLVLSFMASVYDWSSPQQGRVRLWDYTRDTRLGDEMTVAGVGLFLQQTGLILPPQRVQVGLQQKMTAAGGEMSVWGGKLSAGVLSS